MDKSMARCVYMGALNAWYVNKKQTSFEDRKFTLFCACVSVLVYACRDA